MLGKRRTAWRLRLLALDAAALGAAFLAAYAVRVALDRPLGRAAGPLGYYLWLLALIVPVWTGLLAILGGYGLAWTTRSRAWLVARASGLGLVLLTAALFLGRESEVNRSLLVIFAALAAAVLWLGRGWLQRRLRRAGGTERWVNVALVVGTDARAAAVVDALRRYPEAGWRVRGCVSLEAVEGARTVAGVAVTASLAELGELLQGDEVVDEVFFAIPPDRLDQIADALELCESLGVDTRVLVDVHRPAHAHGFVEELFGLPFFGFSPSVTHQGALAVKRALDAAGAALGLALLAPLLAGLALAVKLSSPGPVVFRQERSGFRGRRFVMYKLRTMVADAEARRDEVRHLNEMAGPVFKASGDPRLTAVGRVLRRFSLDELPQLVNVLRGDMSLVGPRPLPLYEASRIKGAQRRRLAMRPGMTGPWQASGRNVIDFEEWMRMDLDYVDRWSLGRDLAILLRTIPTVLLGTGAS